MASAIRRVGRVQTGSGDMHVQHLKGSPWHPLLWIFLGRKWVEGLPINVFMLEHERGTVLFDAGMSPTVTADDYWPDPVTRTFMNNIFRFHIRPEDALGLQLERAGCPPDSVAKVVVSHLHFDHAGGIADVPGAELLVSAEAWEHMCGPHSEREAVLRRDIDIAGANWRQIRFAPLKRGDLAPFTEGHDVMDDGSLILVPTPGHLDGSLSMFVATEPPIMFVGDVCYGVELMLREQFPGTGDHAKLAESWAKVRALVQRIPDLLIIPAHDTKAAVELSSHPLFRERWS